MRSHIFAPILAGAVAAQSGIDFDAVFKAQPALQNLKPLPSAPINRAVSASSIISRMNAVKPDSTPTQAAAAPAKKKTSSSVTAKAKTTQKATLPKLKTTQKPQKTTKKVVKKPVKKTVKKTVKKGKRDVQSPAVCSPQDIQYNYTSNPNTPTGFLVDTLLANIAGLINPPAGYTKSFRNAFGSVNADGYLGYYQLPTYSVQSCADICTGIGDGCQAFNIYFERNPTVDPDAKNCPNPNAATSVRCAVWGSQINATQAVNIGQWRANFMTVVSGSNGYVKNAAPPLVSGYNASVALAGFVNPNSRVALSTTLISGSSYSAPACAQLCSQWNTNAIASAQNNRNATFTPCNYFNAAILSANGVAVPGTYCSLFSGTDVGSYATLFTSVSNSGAAYDISSSYGYALSTTLNGTTPTPAPGSCASLNKTGSADGGRTYEVHCGYDYPGGALVMQRAASFVACMGLCDKTTNCTGAAYLAGSSSCYMKNVTDSTILPSSALKSDLFFLSSGYSWPSGK